MNNGKKREHMADLAKYKGAGIGSRDADAKPRGLRMDRNETSMRDRPAHRPEPAVSICTRAL